MAIQITASVGKKAGLPNYGSKSFTLSCTKEVTDIGNLESESIRLHELLEQIVKAQIEKDQADESEPTEHIAPVNRITSNGSNSNGNGQWRCSDKQRELLLTLVADHNIEAAVQEMSLQMFGKHPKECNRLECSGLISRILEENTGKKSTKGKNGNSKYVSGGMR